MKDDRVFLLHIRDAIRLIVSYTQDGEVAFHADRKTQDAVIRNFEIIREAVKNLSPEFVQSHPGLPWKDMAGMRD